MKKNNLRIKFAAFIASAALLLTGCSGLFNGGGSGTAAVGIRKLSASVYDPTEVAQPAPLRRNNIDIKLANEDGTNGDTEVDSETGEESSANYVLIYKDENDIQLTVQLDNPKGESIDALEIACDDTGAEILVDGQYKSMNVSSNGRVVNWAQEDPYEKTFYMRTISEDDLTTVRINDIKVNGQWQNRGLSNNELKVFKLGEEDMSTTFVTNTPEYYECVINYGANISNLVVTGGEWVGTNHYRMTHNGVMKLDYEYTFAGVVRHWTEERNIELLQYGFYEDWTHTINFNGIQIAINKLLGTGVDDSFVNVRLEGVSGIYKVNKVVYPNGNSLYEDLSVNLPINQDEPFSGKVYIDLNCNYTLVLE